MEEEIEIEFNNADIEIEGIESEKVYPELETLEVKSGVEEKVFTPEKYGYSKVTVKPLDIRLQNKEITENGTYTADDEFDAIGEITVAIQDVVEKQLFEIEEEDIR